MNNDNGVISFENMKRMEARRAKVDETLLQRAEMLTLHAGTDLLLAQGASVTASGKVTEKAAVQRKGGTADGGSTDNTGGGEGGSSTDPNE